MDIGPKTPTEHLCSEASLYQGYQQGVEATLNMLQQRGVNYAQGFADGVKSVTEPAIRRALLALVDTAKREKE